MIETRAGNKEALSEWACRWKRELTQACEDHYGEKLMSVILYGSVARKNWNAHSDLDFLVVARDLPRGRFARVRDFAEVETRLDGLLEATHQAGWWIELSPVFKKPEEVEVGSPLFLDMVEDAELLLDRGDFFKKYLEGLHGRLEQMKAKRIWSGDLMWHWDLKPDWKKGDRIEI